MATAAEIQAELAAGPQTQDALDAALLKYSPAEMAAAFPQFGNVAEKFIVHHALHKLTIIILISTT